MPDKTSQVEVKETAEKKQSGFWTMQRMLIAVSAVLIGIPLLVFIIGVLLAAGVEQTASWIQAVRDAFIITMILEVMLIVIALVVLVMQIARLANLVKNETRPILEDVQDAASAAKGTVQFVGDAVVEPVIKIGAFLAGVRVFISELAGIRRAIRRTPEEERDHAGE
jgi:predicted PurR-regulated permease PerM